MSEVEAAGEVEVEAEVEAAVEVNVEVEEDVKVEVKVEVTTQKGSVNFRKGRPENWKTLVVSERYRIRLSVIGRGGEIRTTDILLQKQED